MKASLRFAAGTTAAILLLTGLAGCGDAGTTPVPAGSPAESPTRSVAEDLTFTGALAGRMTSAGAGDAFACAPTAGAFVAGPILGIVAGSQIELNIAVLSFHGAGTYPPDGVSFDAAYDHYYPASGSSGTLVIAPDLRSGTVDIPLAVNSDSGHVVGHVSGAWRCPTG